MTALLVALETLFVAIAVVVVARRVPAADGPPGRRLLGIAGLLLAQSAVLAGFEIWAANRGLGPARGAVHGLLWLAQALRAALLLAAFRRWLALANADPAGRARRLLPFLALALLGWGAEPMPFLAAAALFFLFGRAAWPARISGWARLAVLLAAPVLLLALTLIPFTIVSERGSEVTIAGASNVWPPRLLVGTLPGAVLRELELARPLDRIVQALVDLFRVQILALALRALTLPVRLSGLSLKRRFLVNYLFVRQVPALLSFVTLAVSAYLGWGLHRASVARSEFERTFTRAGVVAAAVRARPDPSAEILRARAWLAPDSAGAWIAVRRRIAPAAGDTALRLPPEPVLAADPGLPEGLRAFRRPNSADDAFEGLVEAGGALWLAARRPDSTAGRAVEVFVPVDSLYLGRIARGLGAWVRLGSMNNVRVQSGNVVIRDDSAAALRIAVESGRAGMNPRDGRPWFLSHVFVPLGDWRGGWIEGANGALELDLRVTPAMLLRGVADVPAWLVSNLIIIGLLLGLATLIGITEGIAVRSGRGIVQAIEDEVAKLREATSRFGAGDLDHRVPVRGKDELSVLAGSFNEMAASLKRQREELVEKERLEEDLEVARRIQQRMLPQEPPRVAGLEVAAISVPSREVGGDLYHVAPLAGERLALALGDVSGKSVPAALLMSNVISALRTELLREAPIEESLARVNDLFAEQIEPGRFVTLFFAVADAGAGRLRYTSAGHNPPLRLGADGAAEWLAAGGVPLGVLPVARYPAADAAFAPGDVLIVYSDGVSEAERDAAGGGDPELFGEPRLLETALALRGRSAQAIVDGVLEAVRGFANGRPQADDITLLVVKRTG